MRSIRPDQIISESAGARLLQRYIEFAQDPNRAFEAEITTDPAADAESPFEEAVYRELVRQGYKVARQVGCFGYRIDLAILSEDGTRFDLGIECDGATYHSTPTARDRDWLRQQVLEGLGWSIHRIWSTDWIKDPDSQMATVSSALEMSRLRASESQETWPAPSVIQEEKHIGVPVDVKTNEKEPDEAQTVDPSEQLGFEQYESMEINEGSRSVSIHEESWSRLQQLVTRLVETEGPIHEDRIIDAIRRIYGKGRAGRQIKEIIRTAIDEERGSGKIARRALDEGHGNRLSPFLDRPDRPRHVPPRGPAIDGRPIEHIWAGEIEAGLLRIVDSAFGIARDEAITATARAFGFVRVGQGIREAIEGAINRLVSAGQIQESDAGLVRVRLLGQNLRTWISARLKS